MAPPCASSARLALPTLLRQVFRSTGAPDAASLDRRLLTTPLSHRRFGTSRGLARPSGSGDDVAGRDTASSSPADASPADRSSAAPTPRERRRPKAPSRDRTPPSQDTRPGRPPQRKREGWQVQKDALKNKFGEGWSPQKKLSPDALDGIRQLHAVAPDRFTTPVLAEQFKVSPEAIRRILKSKWRPSGEEAEDRRQRWDRRHERIWGHMAELGLRPHTKSATPYTGSQALYGPRKSRGGSREGSEGLDGFDGGENEGHGHGDGGHGGHGV
ncbi:hypothetical protein P168DRAFT_318836 [Aspergillus campestris IBT 28561]|uniref:Required for respiratory growth protein 9, mitochondrial n=1 Tax=Aspergillus campestris (strain IBT 28561) TaxID=1392248 RepID=A0A2I1D3R3_ASPC2|nr:uncharacterized protein P168DRAFT_318836 [Aspergillus campestris IBT 28561]PKY04513.1 hypothetical protein P168DRAFT_318836 [Aspergillus campestris IBT 28561]